MLDYNKHELQRDKLVFNNHKRRFFDNKLLLDSLSDQLDNIKVQKLDIINQPKYASDSPEIYNVFLSDMHIGKYELPYHYDITHKVISKIYDTVPKGSLIQINFVGDIIDGLLRLSQLNKIKANLVEQVSWAIEVIINLLETLKETYTINEMNYITFDNHGEIRPLGSGRNEFSELNFNEFIVSQLNVYCTKSNIPFYSDDKIKIKCGGVEYDMLHGDCFKSKASLEKYYENGFVIHGHFHNYKSTQNIISLPGLVYGDEYTLSLGIVDTEPSFVIEYKGMFKCIELD